eukprot:1710107-Rhodomonas_salina.2
MPSRPRWNTNTADAGHGHQMQFVADSAESVFKNVGAFSGYPVSPAYLDYPGTPKVEVEFGSATTNYKAVPYGS